MWRCKARTQTISIEHGENKQLKFYAASFNNKFYQFHVETRQIQVVRADVKKTVPNPGPSADVCKVWKIEDLPAARWGHGQKNN